MKHTYQPTDNLTGIIAFQSTFPCDSLAPPRIFTINLDARGRRNFVRGLTLGAEDGFHCALFVIVQPRDLVAIEERIPGEKSITWRLFRVGSNFQPLAHSFFNRRPSPKEFASFVQLNTTAAPDRDEIIKITRNFMAAPHFEWLQQAINRQIGTWRETNNRRSLMLFAPWGLTADQIARWVEKGPAMALAHLKNRLSKQQLARCVDACPQEAIQYAFESMSEAQVCNGVANFPKEVLQHAAAKISDDQLRACSSAAPYTAFALRPKIPSKKHAIMIARSYECCWMAKFGFPDSDMHSEMIQSLIAYPAEWLACHKNSCSLIFEGMGGFHRLEVQPNHLLQLLEVMPSNQHTFLKQCLALRI